MQSVEGFKVLRAYTCVRKTQKWKAASILDHYKYLPTFIIIIFSLVMTLSFLKNN